MNFLAGIQVNCHHSEVTKAKKIKKKHYMQVFDWCNDLKIKEIFFNVSYLFIKEESVWIFTELINSCYEVLLLTHPLWKNSKCQLENDQFLSQRHALLGCSAIHLETLDQIFLTSQFQDINRRKTYLSSIIN